MALLISYRCWTCSWLEVRLWCGALPKLQEGSRSSAGGLLQQEGTRKDARKTKVERTSGQKDSVAQLHGEVG